VVVIIVIVIMVTVVIQSFSLATKRSFAAAAGTARVFVSATS
jgi:hypothetical protein